MKKGEVDIITMGCSKNLVDSEALARELQMRGYTCCHDPQKPQGEYVIVNTCGFIQDAKQESIDVILELIELKKMGQIGALIVMGCLSQRYKKELEKALAEVDCFYGKFDFHGIAAALPPLSPERKKRNKGSYRHAPKHYAYVKVSEGCSRRCAFCAIPLITGQHRSRAKEDILNEVKELGSQGVKEIELIAQELTYYGVDIDGQRHIADLVSDLADIRGIEWLRLHYAYPKDFPRELLDVMRDKENVCDYLDIAFQHVSDHILADMQRHFTKRETMALIEKIRSTVPNIHLRTTLMVGFPGETEEDFEELLAFVKEVRFERMGAFAYSEEEGTFAQKHFPDNVPWKVKQERLDRLMALQQEISADVEAQKVGKTLKTIIDRREGNYYVGRTEYSSPEVDPEVLIPATRRLTIGAFYNVKVKSSEAFDLYGEISN